MRPMSPGLDGVWWFKAPVGPKGDDNASRGGKLDQLCRAAIPISKIKHDHRAASAVTSDDGLTANPPDVRAR